MIDFLNKEVLIVAGYNIHVAFFLLIAIIIAIISFIIVMLRKKKGKIANVLQIQDKTKVTEWQKSFIGNMLIEERQAVVEENGGEIDPETQEKDLYIDLIDKFYEYLMNEKVWDSKKLQEIDENLLIVFNTIILDKSKECYLDNDENAALLLAHTIDLMNNGDYIFKNTPNWLGDDVDEMMQHDKMDINEARLFYKSKEALFALASYLYIDDTTRKPGLPDYLDHIIIEDLDEALSDLESKQYFYTLNKTTMDILTHAFYVQIESYLKRLSTSEPLKEYQLYDVRCLCCTLDFDNNLYDYILETIE